MLRSGHMGAVAQALHVIPPSSLVHWTPQFLLHPKGHFGAAPQPIIRGLLLEGIIQLLLLLRAQQGPGSGQRQTMVTDPLPPSAIRAPYDRANPAGGITYPFSHFLWRVALLHQPQNVPMGALYRLAGFAIALAELFYCQLGFHFNSFGHASIIHYLNGFDIISVPCSRSCSAACNCSNAALRVLRYQHFRLRFPQRYMPPTGHLAAGRGTLRSLPDTFSGKRAHSLDGKAPAVFGAMKGQTTGQMRGSNLWLLVPALRKQEPEVEPSQAKKTFVSSNDTIKFAAMS